MILYTEVLYLAVEQLIGRYSDWYSYCGLNKGPFNNNQTKIHDLNTELVCNSILTALI